MSQVRISWAEDKANWLLEQAGDLIPEEPEQITLSQYKILLLDNVIQEVLELGLSFRTFNLSPYTAWEV